MLEDRKVWLAALVMGVLVTFFVGFKYADYRHSQLDKERLAMEEMLSEDDSEEPASNQAEPGVIFVHVTGSVEKPGVFQMKEGDRVFQVLEKARPTAEADTNQLNLAQSLVDGGKIIVPRVGEKLEELVAGCSGVIGGEAGNSGGKVNINTASVSELDDRLPGIGPALAQRIVDYREKNGGFKSPEEITEVPGIGDKRYEQMKDLITVR